MKIISNQSRGIMAIIERVGNSHYVMNYVGDYGFGEYLTRGVSNLEEYIEFVDERLIRKVNLKVGCAAFLARNQENDILLGRNMDCDYGIGMVTRINEKNGYQSLALTNMAELDWDDHTYDSLEQDAKFTLAIPYSPSDGINEHGLAVAILTDTNAIYPNSKDITLLDYSITRLLLDKAKNVEEAIQLVERYNLFYLVQPLHFMVADVSRNAAVIEFVNGKMVTTRNQMNYQVVTNFTLYNNEKHEGFGKDRFDSIQSRLQESNGVISEGDDLTLLQKNVIPGDAQWSAVYNLSKQSVQILFAKDNQLVYQYHLNQ